MQSPQQHPVDARRIAWLGVFFQPLFLRDGLELMFKQDRTLLISNPRLQHDPARPQKQPYGDLLFRETEPGLRALRAEPSRPWRNSMQKLARPRRAGRRPRTRRSTRTWRRWHSIRCAAFWQDRAVEQRQALSLLLQERARRSASWWQWRKGKPRRACATAAGLRQAEIRDGTSVGRRSGADLRHAVQRSQALQRWFANSETGYEGALVAGGEPLQRGTATHLAGLQQYPDTHRVGGTTPAL